MSKRKSVAAIERMRQRMLADIKSVIAGSEFSAGVAVFEPTKPEPPAAAETKS